MQQISLFSAPARLSLLLLGAPTLTWAADADSLVTGGTNAQRFTPALDPARLLTVTDPASSDAGHVGGGVIFNVASDPLVLRYADSDAEETALMSRVGTADLHTWGSYKRIRGGVNLPLHLLSSGYGVEGFRAIGDLRLELDGELIARRGDGFGLGLRALGVLPTGSGDDWLGRTGAEAGLGLAASVSAGPALIAANTTARTGQKAGDYSLTPDYKAALDLGAGVSISMTDAAALSGEINATLLVGAPAYSAPVEALFGVRLVPTSDLIVHLAGGAGLTSGIGAPDWRALAGVSWSPGARPNEVETISVAPAPVAVAPTPGKSQLSITARDEEGRLLNVSVRVSGPTGDLNLSAPNGTANTTLNPGSYAVIVSAEGRIPIEKAVVLDPGGNLGLDIVVPPGRASIAGDRIVLTDRIYFETDSDIIRSQSFSLLDELAQLLLNHPEIRGVAVAGHADDQGSAEHNMDLSFRRAKAVCNYLSRSGVESARLIPVGQGEAAPLVLGTTAEARAQNRRVEFRIVDQTRP